MSGKRPIVVFDLDGTLAETAGDLIRALNGVLALEGIAPVPVSSARSLLGAGGRALISRGFALSKRELAPAKHEALYQIFLADYNSHIAEHSFLYPGVDACLTQLAAEGWALAVCTNKMEASAKLLLEKLGVADRFAFVSGQETFGAAKPDPRPVIETIRAAGGDRAQAIMVGDSRSDIDAAKAAGIPVIAVDFGYTEVPVAELGPDVVISHFDALIGAIASLRRF